MIEPCPFCGESISDLVFGFSDGYKWGAASCPYCGATAPDVRTNYSQENDAPWHKEATEEWNKRIFPGKPKGPKNRRLWWGMIMRDDK